MNLQTRQNNRNRKNRKNRKNYIKIFADELQVSLYKMEFQNWKKNQAKKLQANEDILNGFTYPACFEVLGEYSVDGNRSQDVFDRSLETGVSQKEMEKGRSWSSW